MRLREDLRALSLFALSRAWIVAVAWSACALVPAGPEWPHAATTLESLARPRWDELHYLALAANGYEPDTPHIAFFPAFPLLFGGLARVLGLSLHLTAQIVANAAGATAIVLFSRLCRRDLTEAATTRAVTLLAFFPTSIYFSIGYTESIFFLCVVGALLGARSRRWVVASLCGYFACLTRPNGGVLLLPIVLEYLHIRRLERRSPIGLPLLAFALVPAGLVSFMIYLNEKTGDPLAFSHMNKSNWGRSFTWVWVTVQNTVNTNGERPYTLAMLLSYPFVPLISIVLAIRQRMRLSYVAFATAMLFLYVSLAFLDSIGRYILMLAPMYIAFARLRSKGFYALLLVAFIVMLTITTVLHFRGYIIV